MGRAWRQAPPDRWVVRIGPVSMCLMTCKQLDDAYSRGLVDDTTLVLPDGGRQWITVRERNSLQHRAMYLAETLQP